MYVCRCVILVEIHVHTDTYKAECMNKLISPERNAEKELLTLPGTETVPDK